LDFSIVPVIVQTNNVEDDFEEPAAPIILAPTVVEGTNRYVLQLEGFSDMLESSDDTAVDSLEPELVEIASTHDQSHPELELDEIQMSPAMEQEVTVVVMPTIPPNQAAAEVDEPAAEEESEIYLRRPQFRVDVESSDVECDSDELLMTSEEADSLLSSR
jgi:hypothetical protein